MALTVDVNGVPIQYPQTGDVGWGDNATKFAEEVASVLGKIGQSQAPVNDDIIVSPGNLSVTSGNLSVGGDASVTGNITVNGNLSVNGNSTLGNGTSDTTAITGVLNVDSGVLYVDPVNNRVGINDATPSQALDVTGNVAITGNETVGGTLSVTGNSTLTGNLSVNGNTTLGDASGDSLTINSNGVSIPNGLNFDSNTLVIDAANNRVGIGTNSPASTLHINGDIRFSNTSQKLFLYNFAANNQMYLQANNAGDFELFGGNGSVSNLLKVSSNGQLSAVVPGGSTLYPGYLCRAWVNFNGTGTVAIRASGNVSSITDNGTGSYNINFTTALPDVNYSVCTNSGSTASTSYNTGYLFSSSSASTCEIRSANTTESTLEDKSVISVAVFR